MRAALMILICLCLATSALAQENATSETGWFTDSQTGCAAWTAFPERVNTIHWSGS